MNPYASSDSPASEHGLARASRPTLTWLLFSAAVALIVIAWLIAQHPPISKASAFEGVEDVWATFNLIAAGALPWFFQWAGVCCAVLGFCGSRDTRKAASFAILFSFAFAAIWWCGLAWKFRGMDPLEAAVAVAMFEVASQFGSSSFFDEMLFHFIGPVLGPLQLRGPLNLQGWNFLFVLLSTTLVVGYLLVVGCFCWVRSRSFSKTDCIKFVVAILPFFLPPFIRLVIRIAQMTG